MGGSFAVFRRNQFLYRFLTQMLIRRFCAKYHFPLHSLSFYLNEKIEIQILLCMRMRLFQILKSNIQIIEKMKTVHFLHFIQ